MINRNYIMYLEDIIHCIEKIEQYTEKLSYEESTKNSLVIDAVIRNLEVIGEATRNVPEEITQHYPDVPWKSMIGLRNILIHEYFGVDLEIVWEIIKYDLPNTKPLVSHVLEKLKEE